MLVYFAMDVLIAAADIDVRVKQLAQEIHRDHPDGVHLVCVLKGAFVFLSDLARQLPSTATLDFMAVGTITLRGTGGSLNDLIASWTPVDADQELLVRCWAEKIERPGRMSRIIGSANRIADERFCAATRVPAVGGAGPVAEVTVGDDAGAIIGGDGRRGDAAHDEAQRTARGDRR